MKTYTVGIIGCGRIASLLEQEPERGTPNTHAGCYDTCDRTRIVAGADASDERRVAFGQRWDVSSMYSEWREMLEKEQLDIVSICTYPVPHRDMVVAAAESGAKAVFCEKSIAITLRQADEMIEELRAQGVSVLRFPALETLPGETVFRLYDTFGFPLDLTADILVGHGMSLDQSGFGVIAADIENIDRIALQLADQSGIILFPGSIGFVENFLDAPLVQGLAGFVGQALAIGGLVVNHRDILARHLVGQEIARDGALLIVPATDPENIGQIALGKFRIGRRRRDLQDVFFGINIRRRNGRSRTEMSGDEFYALAGEPVGHGDRLFRITGVIADFELELLPQHPAGGVDILDRHFRAAPHLFAE